MRMGRLHKLGIVGTNEDGQVKEIGYQSIHEVVGYRN
jgi:hypothetical protein